MSADMDREQMIFTCTMMSNYAESYLKSLSDKELLKVYDRITNKEMESNGKHD